MLTDTHAHLDFPDFAEDFDAILGRAAEAGVERIVTISTSIEGSRRAIGLAEKYPHVWAAVGVHPGNADEAPDDVIAPLRELARHPKVVAIGEAGLDYHRLPSASLHDSSVAKEALGNETPVDVNASIIDGAYIGKQALIFQQQLELAAELGLNVVVHERDAWEDTLELIRPYTGRLRAVFHCFGKPPEQMREVLALGHLVSFTGIVTFKNAPLVQASAREVPGDRYMVETDCPYLAPVPHRGKRCEPAHVRVTAEFIAQLRGEPLERVAAATTETAADFFRRARL